jgi:uncharacterized membrane protein
MRATIVGAILFASFTFASVSRADLRFCNSRSDAVYVAVDMSVYYPNYCETYRTHQMVSWYYVAPGGGCATVISGNLTNQNRAVRPEFLVVRRGFRRRILGRLRCAVLPDELRD